MAVQTRGPARQDRARPRARRFRRWSAPVAFVVAVVVAGAAATIAQVGPSGISGIVRPGGVGLLLSMLIVAAATVVNLALRWVRWHGLVRQAGAFLAARSSLAFWVATLPASLTPFGVGELVRARLLRRRGRSVRLALVWLLERVTDVGALGALYLLGDRPAWAAGVLLATVGSVMVVMPLITAGRDLGIPRRAFVAIATTSLAFAAWSTVVLVVPLAAGVAGDGAVPLEVGSETFAGGTLVGGLSGLPGGVAVSGTWMSERLQESGLVEVEAVRLVVALRGGTVWFAAALGIVVALATRARVRAAMDPSRSQAHFDELAPSYADEIPEHMRARYVARKLTMMGAVGDGRPLVLDVGCGHGWYASALAERGAWVVGVDRSVGQLVEAAASVRGVALVAADGGALPFRTGSLDQAYAVNSIHHVTGLGAQGRTFGEVVRCCRRGATFHLHEINPDNPVFRFYVSYVFPLLRSIDDGTEQFISPSSLPPVGGARWTAVQHFSFLPDFLPEWLLAALAPVEARLERSVLGRFSAHYAAVLEVGSHSPERRCRGDVGA